MEKPSIFRETTSTTLLQVCFADSPVAGVLITVGVGLARWECAVGCLLGPFVALLTCFVSLQFLSLSVQSGAAGLGKGFVTCFLEVPLACLGSMAAAVQPSYLWNSQKTCYKTFPSTCRPTL